MSAFKMVVAKPFKSTNFTLQTLMPLILLVGELVGLQEDVTREMVAFVDATLIGAVGFWGFLRDRFKDGISIRYTGNVLTYVFAFIGGFVEWIGNYDLEGVLGQLIEAVQTGNFNVIFPAVFALGNVIYRLTQDKPWTSSGGGDQDDETDANTGGETGAPRPA